MVPRECVWCLAGERKKRLLFSFLLEKLFRTTMAKRMSMPAAKPEPISEESNIQEQYPINAEVPQTGHNQMLFKKPCCNSYIFRNRR